jgi:hypothetical protein
MSRITATLAVILTFASSSLPAADNPAEPTEPPVRLKKKEKPKPAPAPEEKPAARPKKEPGKERVPAPDPENPEKDAAEILARISRNMRSVDERLQKKDVGQGTRQIQRDIVKDLDKLIHQMKNPPPQPQNSSGQANSRDSAQQRQQTSQQVSRQQSAQNPKPNQAKQSKKEAGKRPGGGGDRSQDGTNKIADLYKDVWGHLPETLRQEMDQYSREQFMAKYNDLLKQYYATIAEKGRRKGD